MPVLSSPLATAAPASIVLVAASVVNALDNTFAVGTNVSLTLAVTLPVGNSGYWQINGSVVSTGANVGTTSPISVWQAPDATSFVTCPSVINVNSTVTCTFVPRYRAASVFTLSSSFNVSFPSGGATLSSFPAPFFATALSFNVTASYTCGLFPLVDGVSLHPFFLNILQGISRDPQQTSGLYVPLVVNPGQLVTIPFVPRLNGRSLWLPLLSLNFSDAGRGGNFSAIAIQQPGNWAGANVIAGNPNATWSFGEQFLVRYTVGAQVPGLVNLSVIFTSPFNTSQQLVFPLIGINIVYVSDRSTLFNCTATSLLLGTTITCTITPLMQNRTILAEARQFDVRLTYLAPSVVPLPSTQDISRELAIDSVFTYKAAELPSALGVITPITPYTGYSLSFNVTVASLSGMYRLTNGVSGTDVLLFVSEYGVDASTDVGCIQVLSIG
eukprot:TRINITY_DN5279_c0_g1_i10.p1 TRINITY_DN5279_c0_g1~~TRINITY_DN5279_c0_g1_i10.p1  ORF type:complete len:441 (+),score=180.19 TRINITY_DN5279_c0_g1_i10:109-1431(+)